MRARQTILISIVLHACLYFLITKLKAPTPPPPKIEVTIKEVTKGNPNAQSKSKKAGKQKGKRGSKGKGISLSKLIPKMDSLFEPGPSSNNFIDEDARGTSEWPADSWGAHQDGLLKELEMYIPMERLFTEIQGMLNYPGILGEHGISGSMNVRLKFTDDSKCDWSRTTITEANHYLKYYIAALLKKVCRMDFIERMHMDRTKFADINFNFVILDELNSDINPGDRIAGNVLLFKRTYLKPMTDYQIGPIHGNILVPTYFTVDVMWFMQKWDEIMNDYDPLDEFRDEYHRR